MDSLLHSFKMPFADVDVADVGLQGGDLLLQQWQHFLKSFAFAESGFLPIGQNLQNMKMITILNKKHIFFFIKSFACCYKSEHFKHIKRKTSCFC